MKFSLYNRYIIGQNPRRMSFFAIFGHFQTSITFDTVFLWTCLTTQIKDMILYFLSKVSAWLYRMCILFKNSNQCSEFLQFSRFQNNLSTKKKNSRNIGSHGPIIHQTKLEIKTNILMYYGLIWCNISGVLFFFDKIGNFFTILPSTLHFWLQSLKKCFNQDKFGIFW